MREKKKQILKIFFVILIFAAIIYTFRNSAGPILQQLGETRAAVVVAICVASFLYELVEGWIISSFAKYYNKEFRYRDGLECALYCCFYRVATLGSGAGFAAIYYFHEKKIEFSESTGMYMIQYVMHKVSIALFSVILLVCNFEFLQEYFGSYMWMLILGYGITILVAVGLLLLCCSNKFHQILFWLLSKLNQLTKGRFEKQEHQVEGYCNILQHASKDLLKNKKIISSTILKNILKLAFWYAIPFLVFYPTAHATIFQIMAVMSLTVMLAAVIPSPAGIGSTEFVFTLLFSVLVGTGAAGSASLLYRFATFVFPFLIGTVIAVNHRRRHKSQRK